MNLFTSLLSHVLKISQSFSKNKNSSVFTTRIGSENILQYRKYSSRSNPYSRKLKTPDLIYIPHVLRWLKTKLRFKHLQKTWDPKFSEGAFIYGTTRAVCRVTEVINEDQPEELLDLLTTSARIKLTEDMSTKFSKNQKEIIRLKPEDIKILIPITVNLRTEGAQKKCEVYLRSLALKWHEDKCSLNLILIALQTEFIRDYSAGVPSEWTISIFDVLECAALNKSTKLR